MKLIEGTPEEIREYEDKKNSRLGQYLVPEKQAPTQPPKVKDKNEPSLPNTVTIAWLFHNVPFKLWMLLGTLLFISFVFGITVGQTTFVKEIVGSKPELVNTSKPVILQTKEIELQVAELTKAHNINVTNLQSEIITEEKLAGDENLIGSYQEKHQKTAQRLRILLEEENISYRKNIDALRSMVKR